MITIQTMAEQKHNPGVALWRMKPTNLFVNRFSAPGGFGHGKTWEEEWGKLKKVSIFIFFRYQSSYV